MKKKIRTLWDLAMTLLGVLTFIIFFSIKPMNLRIIFMLTLAFLISLLQNSFSKIINEEKIKIYKNIWVIIIYFIFGIISILIPLLFNVYSKDSKYLFVLGGLWIFISIIEIIKYFNRKNNFGNNLK